MSAKNAREASWEAKPVVPLASRLILAASSINTMVTGDRCVGLTDGVIEGDALGVFVVGAAVGAKPRASFAVSASAYTFTSLISPWNASPSPSSSTAASSLPPPATWNVSVSYFPFGGSALGLVPPMAAPSHVGYPGISCVHENTCAFRYSASVPDAVTAAVTRQNVVPWHASSAKTLGTVSTFVFATLALDLYENTSSCALFTSPASSVPRRSEMVSRGWQPPRTVQRAMAGGPVQHPIFSHSAQCPFFQDTSLQFLQCPAQATNLKNPLRPATLLPQSSFFGRRRKKKIAVSAALPSSSRRSNEIANAPVAPPPAIASSSAVAASASRLSGGTGGGVGRRVGRAVAPVGYGVGAPDGAVGAGVASSVVSAVIAPRGTPIVAASAVMNAALTPPPDELLARNAASTLSENAVPRTTVASSAAIVGDALGACVGAADGRTLGLADGAALGASVGASVGLRAAVGSADGERVGLALGAALGLALGAVLGLAVGPMLGFFVGHARVLHALSCLARSGPWQLLVLPRVRVLVPPPHARVQGPHFVQASQQAAEHRPSHVPDWNSPAIPWQALYEPRQRACVPVPQSVEQPLQPVQLRQQAAPQPGSHFSTSVSTPLHCCQLSRDRDRVPSEHDPEQPGHDVHAFQTHGWCGWCGWCGWWLCGRCP